MYFSFLLKIPNYLQSYAQPTTVVAPSVDYVLVYLNFAPKIHFHSNRNQRRLSLKSHLSKHLNVYKRKYLAPWR